MNDRLPAHPGRFISGVLAVAVLCASLTACSADPDTAKQKYFARAEQYFLEKKYDEAIVEYRNAIQQDPQFAEARFKLAEAYVAKSDYRNAYPEYIRAADLKPDDLVIQARTGNMLLLGRRFEEARARARIILQKDPSNLEALILLGNALAGLGDLPNAVQIAERAVAVDPQREGTRVNLGALQLMRGNEKEAEEAFTTAVRLNQKSLSAHLALANFYHHIGNFKAAEDAFTRALAIAPDDVRTNRALASFQVSVGKPQEAERYLRSIAEKTNEPASWSDLADYYTQQRRDSDAVVILEKLSNDPKQYASARRRIAVIAHSAGRRPEADAILSDLLKRNPADAEALTTRARLLFSDRKYDEALEAAKSAVQANPRSAPAHLILGRALVARGDLPQARRALAEAISLDPRALEARLALASLHLSESEIDAAVEHARAAVDVHPESLEARLLLGRALVIRPEDRAQARANAEAIARDFPRSAAGPYALGTYYRVAGDKASAYRQFEHALQLNPAFFDALAELISLDAAAGRSEAARQRVQAHLALRPDDPGALMLHAKLSLTARQLGDAERTLRKAAALPNPPPEAYTLLGRLFIAQGKLAEATKEFSELVRNDPQSVAGHVMLGLLLHAQRDVPGAIEHYEKAVALDPRTAAPAANNLAWLYAESGENLDRALELAQAARLNLPGDAEPLDTLGWVYRKKGVTSQAETFVRQAIDLSPGNPLFHYHLGVIYAEKGDDANARTSLQRALTLQPGKQIAQDAKRILSTLVY
ncbi:MAG: tetratricopeptide repeat protein [Vicinamibacterales bacterium]